MPKQLISVGPAPYKTPQRIAAPSSSGTLALGYSVPTDDWLFYEPAPGAGHAHPYSHTSNWDETLDVDLSVAGTHTIDYATARTHDLTLTGYTALSLSGALTGFATDLRVKLRQDGTGSRTVAWPSTINWETGGIPTLQTGANAVDYIGLVSTDDGVTFDGFHSADSPHPDLSTHDALGLATDAELATHAATSHGYIVVMRPDIDNPPEPVLNVDGTGWVYAEDI